MVPRVGQSVQYFEGDDGVPLAAIVVKVHTQNVDSYIEGSVDLTVYHVDGQRWTLETRVPPSDSYRSKHDRYWRPIPE